MSRILASLKRTNEVAKMVELGRFITESGDVVLDQEFGLTAKYLHVAVTGDVVFETPYYENGIRKLGVIRGATPNFMIPVICTKVLTADGTLGPTTATGITWHTGA